MSFLAQSLLFLQTFLNFPSFRHYHRFAYENTNSGYVTSHLNRDSHKTQHKANGKKEKKSRRRKAYISHYICYLIIFEFETRFPLLFSWLN